MYLRGPEIVFFTRETGIPRVFFGPGIFFCLSQGGFGAVVFRQGIRKDPAVGQELAGGTCSLYIGNVSGSFANSSFSPIIK